MPELAAAESVVLLEGWNDELVLERAGQIGADAPGYVEVARSARRAQARLAGQEEAIALLQQFIERTDNEERRAALRAEIVQAHLDSLQEEEHLRQPPGEGPVGNPQEGQNTVLHAPALARLGVPLGIDRIRPARTPSATSA